VHVPFGDVEALAAAVGPGTAAVVLEPVQGEGGVRPAPPGYLAVARRLTRDAGALLILDEVQSGAGRTGAWFAHQHPLIAADPSAADPTARWQPDVVTIAKGIAGGLPIGAVVALGDGPGAMLGPGQHGTTFGGNPVACAAALATLHVVERDGLLEHARAVGERLRDGILGLGHPLVADVRGHGLLLGLALRHPVAGAATAAALEAGLIVNAVTPDTLRIAPPLVLTTEQADDVVAALPTVLDLAAREA
jgi:acetylornithine/N-succinyldiaminopimelate aminotransferase